MGLKIHRIAVFLRDMDISSKHIQRAVDAFASLPGIGRKTGLRLALHLLNRSKEEVQQFGESFIALRSEIQFCKTCSNVSDTEECGICASPRRDHKLVCVVQDFRDVMAIESTHQFQGVFHVLGGIISPMDGIGPNDLNVESLIERVQTGEVTEIILALSTTMEGDTTNFYLYKRLKDLEVDISTLARGVAIGDELEYTDEVTLGRSIVNRLPYEGSLAR